MAEKEAYVQAARTGMYEKPKGLLGKYDNVRRFWEDQLTVRLLAPALSDLIMDRKRRDARIRILDLGCGSGDGLELLTRVPLSEDPFPSVSRTALPLDLIEDYVGLDLNEDLICQAEACHGAYSGVKFIQGDLSHGLPATVKGMSPFDIYFAGYGTLSHFHDDQSSRIVADIAEHAPDRAVFVGDWLGRHSYEWQDLWPNPLDQEYFMDYRISYIYPEEERDVVEVSSFPLRLMTQDEVLAIVADAASLSGAEIVPLAFFDRSIFVGRHMDTGDYNRHCPKLRQVVNSLFEYSTRTDLDSLIVDYSPLDGYEELNNFFGSFFAAANDLIGHTQSLLARMDGQESDSRPASSRSFHDSPGALKEAKLAMDRVVESVRDIQWCDVRANFIEPMLGFCLRKLEMELQTGSGRGHGLVGVFEIRK